ncbi:YlxM family DNA-binding protein [Paenibacillus hamazuiensis]|uniref:YlxM family DNA-binding protein n=1 Tax=Paenibacillus hamazuiensis TaxID=2936508 RepID=UPI00200C0145
MTDAATQHGTEAEPLEKTNRINLLFDFYEPLLTEKQQMFMKAYFHDDYSLGEIAAEFQISRQAVFEHIKRAEQSLADYEDKLQLLAKHERRVAAASGIDRLLETAEADLRQQVRQLLDRMLE